MILAQLLEYAVGDQEGVVRVGVEREAAHEVYDRHLAHGGVKAHAAPAGALGRKVGRAQHAHLVVQVGLQLPARPGVVAQGDAVGARVEYRVHLPGRAADDVRVLAVDHDEVRAQLALYRAQPPLKIFKSR